LLNVELMSIAAEPYQARNAVIIPVHPPILTSKVKSRRFLIVKNEKVIVSAGNKINQNFDILYAATFIIRVKMSQANRKRPVAFFAFPICFICGKIM
jgi:hypothetical protein